MLLIRFLLFTPYRIPSESMLPTLGIGDRVVVNQLSYSVGDVQRGQVVVFDRPQGFPGTDDVIKRVVALPGETIRFIDGQVYIDSLRMVEPYLIAEGSTRANASIAGCGSSAAGTRTCVIPEGHVFVLGDNRLGSTDSRSFGPIPIDTIIGRASVRIWPPLDVARI